MKVLVGISGGLDSAYAAQKLIREGHSVEGAIVLMHEFTDVGGARSVADSLGVKLHVIDARELFEGVKENFISEYSEGRTPNPCIVCNPLVKFRALADFAKKQGFDKIATGHYAKVCTVESDGEKRYTFKRAKDSRKDQTYMLHRLPQDILSMLLLPLSDEIKSDIKAHADGLGLSAANKNESQEICFIPDGDYASYIESKRGKFTEGNFVLADGTVVGKHKGIIHYTVGQRKGLGVSYGERVFVNKIDAISNEILLATETSKSDRVKISDIVYSGMHTAVAGEKRRVEVKLRYLASPVGATVIFDGGEGAVLLLDTPVSSVTPGQSAVMYDGDLLLCGGFIRQ